MIKLGILGANGKMGRVILGCLKGFGSQMSLEAALVSSRFKESAEFVGFAGQYGLSESKFSADPSALLGCDYVVDFSMPEVTLEVAKFLRKSGVKLVTGVTGFTEAQMAELRELSREITVVWASNFSYGVNVMLSVLRELSSSLDGYDAEVFERHHSKKKDAPSGTSLMMGRAIAEMRGQDFEAVKVIERNGVRRAGDIGFACVRQGGVFGFHEVSFANEDERVFLGHEAFNKEIFAKGALKACILAESRQLENGFFLFQDLIF